MQRLLCLAAFFAATCAAQSSAGGGTIQGTVKDSSGLAIPKAKITITHIDSGTTIHTEGNGDGFFATPPIKIGRYKVRVESAGMKTWEGEVLLEQGPRPSLQDLGCDRPRGRR